MTNYDKLIQMIEKKLRKTTTNYNKKKLRKTTKILQNITVNYYKLLQKKFRIFSHIIVDSSSELHIIILVSQKFPMII